MVRITADGASRTEIPDEFTEKVGEILRKALSGEVNDFGLDNVLRVLSMPALSDELVDVFRRRIAMIRRMEIIPVEVDYSKDLRDLISRLHLVTEQDITDQNFRMEIGESPGKRKTNLVLYLFDRPVSSEESVKELNGMGLEIGTIHDLLALDQEHASLKRCRSIVALGSVWQGKVPVLREWAGTPEIYLEQFKKQNWHGGDFWFLARSKSVDS